MPRILGIRGYLDITGINLYQVNLKVFGKNKRNENDYFLLFSSYSIFQNGA